MPPPPPGAPGSWVCQRHCYACPDSTEQCPTAAVNYCDSGFVNEGWPIKRCHDSEVDLGTLSCPECAAATVAAKRAQGLLAFQMFSNEDLYEGDPEVPKTAPGVYLPDTIGLPFTCTNGTFVGYHPPPPPSPPASLPMCGPRGFRPDLKKSEYDFEQGAKYGSRIIELRKPEWEQYAQEKGLAECTTQCELDGGPTFALYPLVGFELKNFKYKDIEACRACRMACCSDACCDTGGSHNTSGCDVFRDASRLAIEGIHHSYDYAGYYGGTGQEWGFPDAAWDTECDNELIKCPQTGRALRETSLSALEAEPSAPRRLAMSHESALDLRGSFACWQALAEEVGECSELTMIHGCDLWNTHLFPHDTCNQYYDPSGRVCQKHAYPGSHDPTQDQQEGMGCARNKETGEAVTCQNPPAMRECNAIVADGNDVVHPNTHTKSSSDKHCLNGGLNGSCNFSTHPKDAWQTVRFHGGAQTRGHAFMLCGDAPGGSGGCSILGACAMPVIDG